MRITRRAIVAGATSLLAAPNLSLAESDPSFKELHARAKDEGELTWYVVYMSSEQAENYGQTFMTAYPGVRAKIVRLTAQVAYQRLNQDIQAGIANCDVFASTDLGHHVALKERGLLMPYRAQNEVFIDERMRGLDPDNMFRTTAAATIAILYNTNKVKPTDAPRSWKALIEPRWKGKVAVGHPGFSGFVGTWVVQMNKMYGWSYFEALAASRPQVGRSIIDTVTNTVSGERSVAAGPAGLARFEAARGNPIAVTRPEEGSVLMITPSAIMANTRRPNAAKLFTEWLYSRDAAELTAAQYEAPLRPDVPMKTGVEPLAQLKTIRPTTPEIVAGIPLVTEKWRDTFGV